VSAGSIAAAASQVHHPKAEAIFISCTGLRTFGAVEGIEEALGVPCVTSNQTLAWNSLRLSGINTALPDRGSLFQL
jgi:maleate isomerase